MFADEWPLYLSAQIIPSLKPSNAAFDKFTRDPHFFAAKRAIRLRRMEFYLIAKNRAIGTLHKLQLGANYISFARKARQTHKNAFRVKIYAIRGHENITAEQNRFTDEKDCYRLVDHFGYTPIIKS